MMTTFTETDNRPKMTKFSESDKSPIRIRFSSRCQANVCLLIMDSDKGSHSLIVYTSITHCQSLIQKREGAEKESWRAKQTVNFNSVKTTRIQI